MIIVCDVDEVLNNLMDVTLKTYNKEYAANYTINDLTAYNFENCFDQSTAHRIKNIFDNPSIWDKVKPIHGAQDGLQKLINAGHQVYLATDHNPATYKEKVEWIRRFFPYIESSKIMCIKDKWIINADVMIEDCLSTLLAKTHYHRIIVDRPWNQSTKDWVYNIHRCSNWNNIVDVVNKLNEEE